MGKHSGWGFGVKFPKRPPMQQLIAPPVAAPQSLRTCTLLYFTSHIRTVILPVLAAGV